MRGIEQAPFITTREAGGVMTIHFLQTPDETVHHQETANVTIYTLEN